MGWCWVGLEEPCERGDAEGVHGYVLLLVITFVEGGRQGVGFTVPRWVRCGNCGPIINFRLSQLVLPPLPTRVEVHRRFELVWVGRAVIVPGSL